LAVLNDPKFEEKFAQSIEVLDCKEAGEVRKIDISPDGNLKDIVFLAPGWLETLEANKYLIKSLVDYGYRVISLQHPREGGSSKKPSTRRTAAISTVIDSLDGEKMQVIANSLGAIDIAEYADPQRNSEAHTNFKGIILTNPAGLNKRRYGLIKLLTNYVRRHMGQKTEADDAIAAMQNRGEPLSHPTGNGIPTTEIATEIRQQMEDLGKADFNSNLPLAVREALLVAYSKIQTRLQRIRQQGHKIHVFIQDEDRLFPKKEYKLRVSNKTGADPTIKASSVKYVAPEKAEADSLTNLPGYHGTPRNAHRRDLKNPQWRSHVWIDAALRDVGEDFKTL